MDKVNRVLCEKMISIGCNVMFKAAGRKWVFLNIDAEDGPRDEQLIRLRENGIEFIELNGTFTFYYAEDYDYVNGSFIAMKDLVTSFPIACCTQDRPSTLRVLAKHVDLTDFCGVIDMTGLSAEELIVGDAVRFKDLYFLDIDSYADEVFEKRDYSSLTLKATSVKIVGDTPITSMQVSFTNTDILKSVDLSEANLTECMNFKEFCAYSKRLQSVRIGEINKNAQCTGAFLGDELLPKYYNSSTLKSNELAKIQAIQEKKPALYVVIDEPNLKIAATNLSAEAIESVFSDYTCKVIPYQRAEDSVVYPYAFLFRKGVQITDEVYKYLCNGFPELVQELTGKTFQEALQASNVF